MSRRSGGHHWSQGRWWEHHDGPSWLVEPEPRTPRHNLPDLLASKYPTLMQISEYLRRGRDIPHETLVNAMEWALRHSCPVTLYG
jgi:hypothetical protein